MVADNNLSDNDMAGVTVRVFSVIAEATGRREIAVDLDVPATARELVEHLAAELPVVNDLRSVIRVAVNREYVDLDQVISEGDEVALITPVSGG